MTLELARVCALMSDSSLTYTRVVGDDIGTSESVCVDE